MSEPSVSVCVVTYNQEQYIRRCLESVVSQLPPGEIEVLVGDDGSSDATRAIIREFVECYPNVVIPVFNEVTLGPSENYRKLISRARGAFVAHIDGDDFWLPGKLRAQLAILRSNTMASAVLTNALVVGNDGSEMGFFTDARRDSIDLNYLVEKGNYLCHSSLLYRAEHRGCILAIKGNFIDYMILVRLAGVGRLLYLDRAYVGYRWNASASMRATMTALVNEGYWQALQQASICGVSTAAFQGGVARFVERVLLQCLLQRRMDTAWEWVCRIRNQSNLPVLNGVLLGVLRVPLGILRHLRRRLRSRRFKSFSVFYRR